MMKRQEERKIKEALPIKLVEKAKMRSRVRMEKGRNRIPIAKAMLSLRIINCLGRSLSMRLPCKRHLRKLKLWHKIIWMRKVQSKSSML